MSKHTPGPWRYETGGGHAYNRIVGSDAVQTNGWPYRINGISNASYSERVCENLGDTDLPGPAANVRLITAAPDLLALAKDVELHAAQRYGLDFLVKQARAAIKKATE